MVLNFWGVLVIKSTTKSCTFCFSIFVNHKYYTREPYNTPGSDWVQRPPHRRLTSKRLEGIIIFIICIFYWFSFDVCVFFVLRVNNFFTRIIALTIDFTAGRKFRLVGALDGRMTVDVFQTGHISCAVLRVVYMSDMKNSKKKGQSSKQI